MVGITPGVVVRVTVGLRCVGIAHSGAVGGTGSVFRSCVFSKLLGGLIVGLAMAAAEGMTLNVIPSSRPNDVVVWLVNVSTACP